MRDLYSLHFFAHIMYIFLHFHIEIRNIYEPFKNPQDTSDPPIFPFLFIHPFYIWREGIFLLDNHKLLLGRLEKIGSIYYIGMRISRKESVVTAVNIWPIPFPLELDGNKRRRHLSKFNNLHWNLRSSFSYELTLVLHFL